MSPSSTRRRASTAVLVLATAALFATGCGDDSATTTTEAEATATTISAGQTTEASVKSGEVAFDGLVDYPMTLTVLDLDYMNWLTVTVDNPTLGPTEYDGVLLADIFSYVGVQADARVMVLRGADGSSAEVSLSDLTLDDAIMAVSDDDVMTAVLPGLDSEAWVEDIVAMEFK